MRVYGLDSGSSEPKRDSWTQPGYYRWREEDTDLEGCRSTLAELGINQGSGTGGSWLRASTCWRVPEWDPKQCNIRRLTPTIMPQRHGSDNMSIPPLCNEVDMKQSQYAESCLLCMRDHLIYNNKSLWLRLITTIIPL